MRPFDLRAKVAFVALFGLLASASEVVDDEYEAVVISAEEPQSDRSGRQLTLVADGPVGAACKTDKGVEGYCHTYSHCYPFYQLSMTTPAWAYGSKDSCSYSDDNGDVSQGHCCVESVQRQAWGPLAKALIATTKTPYWSTNYGPWVLNQLWGVYPQAQRKWWGQGVQTTPQWGSQRWVQPQQQWGRPVWGQGGQKQPGAVRVPQWGGAGQQWGQQQNPWGQPIQQAPQWGQPQNPWGQPIQQAPQNPWGQPIQQAPQNPWGQQPIQQAPQNPWGQQPIQQQPVYPQGGAPGAGGFPGAGGQPQPQPPQVQVPQVPQVVPQVPQQPVGGVGGGDADVVGGQNPVNPAPVAPGGGGDYSQCGQKNGQVKYDEDGEDAEAIERLNFKPELRIRGGWSADMNEWPWIVGIYRNNRQFCGGSLIDPTHVLTAAHCIDHMKSSDIPTLQVKLGDHDINSESETVTQNIKVAQIVKHKGFSQSTLHNDVAILRLSSPAQYTRNVRPVCLAPQGANVPAETVATVVGWGLTSETGPRPPHLQEITFKVWDNTKCKDIYGSMAPGGITEHMLCAGQKGQDSCMGDSGGPMVRLQGGSYQQIGIVSWGIGCGKAQFPGVYTRVGFMRSWIDKARSKY